VVLYTELFYAIIPTLFLCFNFNDLLSLHLVTFLKVFILTHNVTHNGFVMRKTHVIVAEEYSHLIIVSSYGI